MNIILIGAQASGKMTIGQELEKQSDLVLFHNHESIDFVTKFIPMSTEARELINTIRMEFFKIFAKTNQQMIFTVVIDFNDSDDIAFLEEIQSIFQQWDREVLFVELETDLQERLKRNKTENRLYHKPIKRHIEWSEKDILETATFANFNPEKAPESLKRYVKVNNTELSPQETAQLILQKIKEIQEN
ncbi:shikimate kinase [Streptococcus hillyeri]|uniref:Shikimate kinase n=1 Tax=Streptococcus hillyeri TaxID=2282420 RepID=A0A3L9DRD1_9STRE|nr:shikimate kinase [Streptococcus hillyeri]RLY01200.1 shikimate kinase [Streptococcus hillyeri]